jgi:c-di-GMP-binding flagellar brake protein YcgR
MKFTDTRFVEITKLMRALKVRPDGSDKRRAARVAIRLGIQIKVMTGKSLGPWQTVELRDVSPRGIRFVFKELLEIGSSFIVAFPAKGPAKVSAPVICRVVHCSHEQNQTYLIGAEFDGPMRTRHPGVESAGEEDRIRRRILD